MAPRSATASSSRRRTTAPTAPRSISRAAGVGRRADRRSAPRGRKARWRRPRAPRASRSSAGAEILGARRAPAGQRGAHQASRRRAKSRLRRASHVGRMDALGASLLAIARQARVRRGAAALQAGRVGAARAVGRRLQCDLRSCGRARGRRRGGARRGDGRRLRRAGPREPTPSPTHLPRLAPRTSARRPFAPTAARRRSSISRTTSAPRT